MIFKKREIPYRYLKAVVCKTISKSCGGKRESFLEKVADAIWSDTAYKVIGYWLLVIGIGGILTFSYPLANSYVSLKIEELGKVLIAFSQENKKATEVVAITPEEPKIVFENKQFNIEIEKIGLNSVVLPDVDANDPTIYNAALKKGLVHAEGSALPGEGKMIYIFGHSTSYEWFVAELNALFYKLKDLVAGDVVVLRQDDKTLSYKVFDKQIVEAGDITILEKNKAKDVLVLQTCYPPGTSLKRLLILANPIK